MNLPASRRCAGNRWALGLVVAAAACFPLAWLGYRYWMATQQLQDPYGYGLVYTLIGAGLVAALLVVVALICAIVCLLSRRKTQQRADGLRTGMTQ
ncbi:hypothetical protein [Luteimonas sp. 3794]|uniref:hypothetical protein n=1 Tax=Luteimonas sp. 3794 TaxID=2817730 RepID=UPI0028655134|nr:hypothetical protein [Luteimonas sp. 3794]MDR6992359.1 putative membrane protein [Luteimonas sp. 3794]